MVALLTRVAISYFCIKLSDIVLIKTYNTSKILRAFFSFSHLGVEKVVLW